ncbi:MAG: Gfo/Idh/MocA family protein, partial [Chloroflexota bacterium]
PVETHFDLCLATIRARCAVICEKPLAANTGQAVALQQAAAEASVPTAVNFTYRSAPGYRLSERLLAVPGFGRPLHAEFALLQGHNFLPGYPRASALLDSGVHLFDTVISLCDLAGLGHLAEVSAAPMVEVDTQQWREHASGEAGPDFGWGFLARTTSGAIVSATFSRAALGWRNGLRWSLYGEDGAIAVELDAGRTEARLSRRGDERPQGMWRPIPVPPDLLADDARFPQYHLDRLVGALRGDEPFPGFAAAVATHRLADALATSAATRRWVAVER